MNYFILIVADADKCRLSRPSAYQLALYRLERQEWGLNAHTRCRSIIAPGDKVVIYASGKREHGMCFVASATVASGVTPLSLSNRGKVDAPSGDAANQSCSYIRLKDVKLLSPPLPIRSILHNISFVPNPKSSRWGVCLIGGARNITVKDYNTIITPPRKGRRSGAPPTLPD